MKLALPLLALGCLSASTMGAASAERYDGDRLIVLDGDTFALPCDVPIRGCAEKVRLIGIDAPEVFHPSCEAERVAGLRAKERAVELIRGQIVELVRSEEVDRYGRTLGALRVPSGEVGSILLQEGLALSYRPGRAAREERTVRWCGSARR